MVETETLASVLSFEPKEDETNAPEDQPMTDAVNPSDDTDSESDSDSESDDEAQLKAQIDALEAQLYNNPSDYDAHVQYIKFLRKQGDIEKLRQAREAMSSLFPLSPVMWREWAKDETTVSSGAEAISAIEKVYERGVSDYLSVDLWCDYLNFVQEYDPSVCECSAAGISKARNLFERALTAVGLHFTEGHRIWELYRDFEETIFLTIEETNAESKGKQTQRVRTLFHRQLSIPLSDQNETLATYKVWEANHGISADANNNVLDGLPSNIASAYQKALDMLNARVHFEEQISKKDADSEKLQKFMDYLKFELSSGDPARIQILYERAIAEFPVSSDLWLDYTQYLDKTFKTARIVRDAYYRASRNCPWVGDLWVRYLLSLERGHCSEEELTTVFERSLQSTFSSFDEYLNIFLTRVDGLRRKLSASKQVDAGMDYAVVRNIFQRASDYLSPHLNSSGSLLQMHNYWARLELKLGKDLMAARGVWESFLKTSGSMLEAWQCYIGMETELGHINEARSLYKRCYSKRFPGTGSEDICHSWVRFEREHGSLEQFDIAVQKVTPRLEELQLFRLQQENANVAATANRIETPSRKNAREKRKAGSSLIAEHSPTKRRKNMDQNMKYNDEDRNGTERNHPAEGNKEAAEAPSNQVESTRGSQDNFTKKSGAFNDQCTAFISNLNPRATEGDLRKFFGDVDGVVAIRILKDKVTRKSRGLAYVDFCDDSHLSAALEKNKQFLMGKKLSILKSDPQGRRNQAAAERGSKSFHGKGNARESTSTEGRDAPMSASYSREEEKIHLKGKNTFFAVPRNVKPLGWSRSTATTTSKPQSEGEGEGAEHENPKSNEEFRKMFLKKN